MKKILFILLGSALGYSQSTDHNTTPFRHIGIGIKASTLGVGLEVTTNLYKYLRVRGGLNFFSYSDDFKITLKDKRLEEVTEYGYIPKYKTEGDLTFSNGHILLDYYPIDQGIFHITAGVYLGKNILKTLGYLINPDTGEPAVLKPGEEWPDLSFDEYEVAVNPDGSLEGTLLIGRFVKPYLGLGLGRSVPKRRIGFMFELGIIYQGDLIVKQNGKEVNLNESLDESFKDSKKIADYLKWWPMINFQLTYRLF